MGIIIPSIKHPKTWGLIIHSKIRHLHYESNTLPIESQEQRSARPCAGCLCFPACTPEPRQAARRPGGLLKPSWSPRPPPLIRVSPWGPCLSILTCVEYLDQITQKFLGRADTAGVGITLGDPRSIKCYMLDFFFFLTYFYQICRSGGI